MRAIRWSDNDRYWGPFTYARDSRGYRPFGIVLGSGDGDDYPHCRLQLSGFGHTLIVRLPAIIKPWRRWVDTSRHSWSSEPGGYWDTGKREYGFRVHEGHLSVAYGRVTNDSSTEQRWGWFMPWRSWRHVRRSFYGLNGEHVSTLPDTGKSYLGDPGRWDRERAIEEACPTVEFAFLDYDGEALTATTRIEEREWRLGEGKFKWLSWFAKPKIRRSLDIRFSGETGRRKGSWKGGTIGTGIDMQPGELHHHAFARYCNENNMIFRGEKALLETAEQTR